MRAAWLVLVVACGSNEAPAPPPAPSTPPAPTPPAPSPGPTVPAIPDVTLAVRERTRPFGLDVQCQVLGPKELITLVTDTATGRGSLERSSPGTAAYRHLKYQLVRNGDSAELAFRGYFADDYHWLTRSRSPRAPRERGLTDKSTIARLVFDGQVTKLIADRDVDLVTGMMVQPADRTYACTP